MQPILARENAQQALLTGQRSVVGVVERSGEGVFRNLLDNRLPQRAHAISLQISCHSGSAPHIMRPYPAVRSGIRTVASTTPPGAEPAAASRPLDQTAAELPLHRDPHPSACAVLRS